MILPTDAAMTTRRSSLSGTLAARIGLLCARCDRGPSFTGTNPSAGQLFQVCLSSRHYATEPRPKRLILYELTAKKPLGLLLLVLGLELGDHRRIGQGRGVAQGPALGDIAQEPAHDLAAPRLRQLRREDDVVRPRQCSDLLGHVGLELVHELGRAVDATLHRDERGD